MVKNATTSIDGETTDNTWLNWCRLCAKKSNAGHENSIIFTNDSINSTLTTSIGKFFWVNIKPEDEIPKRLCRECQKLIDELVGFTERVNKVQTMYCILQNLKQTTVDAANKLRSQFGVSDDGWEHIIKINEKPPPPPKPEVANREIQTDLIIFFNKHCQEIKPTSQKELPAQKAKEINDKQSYDVEVEDDDYVEDIDAEQGNPYEYILNEDNDEAEAVGDSYSKDDIKLKLDITGSETTVEDSDLFKELKFKMEEADEEQSACKNVQLDINQLDGSSESELVGSCNDEQGEVGDDQEYIEILDYKGEQNSSDSVQTVRRCGRLLKNSKNNTNDADYQYDCPDCKRKYKTFNVYRKHVLVCHGSVVGKKPNFICPVCKCDCTTASRLKKHMQKHLPDEEKYTVPCPYCDKKFSKKAAMKTHVNGIHHQLKPFICDQCGRACKTLSSLNEHKLVHTDECPFTCDVCQKQFKNKARLKSHMDTHTESEYSCPDCNLKLNTKRTLLQHRLVHSNIKRFKCQFCDAAFKRSKALKNHLILHTGLRPYKCPFCDKSFSNGSNCRSHKKRAHPLELAQEEALGIKSESASIPKLEDLKAAKDIVQPRVLRRHERAKKETSVDFESVIAEGNYEIADIQYEIEEEQEDDVDMEEGSQEFIDDGEETVIYEIIGEV